MDLSELHDQSQLVEAIHYVKHIFGAQGSSVTVSVVEIVEMLVSELLILQDQSLKSFTKFFE